MAKETLPAGDQPSAIQLTLSRLPCNSMATDVATGMRELSVKLMDEKKVIPRKKTAVHVNRVTLTSTSVSSRAAA
jgi:hypothetical protein